MSTQWDYLGDPELVAWLESHRDPVDAWTTCPRGDWLLLALGRGSTDRLHLVRAVCRLVRGALARGPTDARLSAALDAAEAWTEHGDLGRFLLHVPSGWRQRSRSGWWWAGSPWSAKSHASSADITLAEHHGADR